jgi:hypothetical protein
MQLYNSADERKVIDRLSALVDFESRISEIAVDGTPQVHLSVDGKGLTISSAGVDLQGDLNRSLIHQIGGRIWPRAGEFAEVAERWETSFQQSKSQLESDITGILSRHDLKIRYVEKGGCNRIYGIVTPHFVEVNPLDFRAAFLEEARRSTALVAKTKRVDRTPFGNVVEFFHFDSPGFQVDLEYGLVYASLTSLGQRPASPEGPAVA